MNNLVKYGAIMCMTGATMLQNVIAAEWTNRTTISGFSSATYQRTNETTAFNGADHVGINNHGSFNGTRIGININSKVNDKIRLASQFVSNQENNDYSTKLDWAFISIDLTDSLTLRTGKVKYPVGIVNEYRAVGYAYPWITPPTLMYSLISSGPQATREAYSGASLLWTKEIDDFLTSIDLFTGEVNLESMQVHSMVGTTAKIDWQDIITIQG